MSKIWKDIKEAIGGTEQDFTEGKISRAIFLLSIPMVLEMLMESVFAVVDIYFVSKLGAHAVATVGITESLLTIIYALGIGFSMATTALVARRIGEKKPDDAAIVAFQAILIGLIISGAIAMPCMALSKTILRAMGADEQVVSTGYMYTSLMLGGNGIIMLLFIINAVFRSAGDAAISMRVLWLANGINIILDPLFIFGIGPFPELGVTGAAIATNMGRGIGVLYQLYILFKGKTRIRLLVKHLKVRLSTMKKLVRLSLGGVGQFLIATSSWIVLMRIMAEFGSIVVAGYTIAIRILIFSILPSWGMSNAASTMVGQNLGAKQPDRAERSVWITGFANMIFLLLVAVIFLAIPGSLMRIFTNDQEIIQIGINCLRILCIGYPFYAFGMVMAQAFNGAGDTFTPTWLNFICFWIIEIPLAYLLAKTFAFNEKGIFFAITVSESILGILGILIFIRGKWKLREV